VSNKFQLRLSVLIASAVAALMAWKWVPGTRLDQSAFATVARGSANGPLFISGAGSVPDPWKLQTFSSNSRPDQRQAPVIVSLGDDLEGFFQSSPPAPIDLAVIFTNFQRLGAEKAATAAVFAWEKPDPVGLAAFEKSLAGFDSLVMAVPLSRGVVAAPMPPSLRRASIPTSQIQGNPSTLPLVNRLPIPGIILGGEATIAGFSVLESEPSSRLLPLLARWEDRIVFSFPLLTVLQRLDLPLDGIEVRLGEFLKLGPSGPIIPIDGSGRLSMPVKSLAAYAEISAAALIDGGDDLFPKQAPDPVILRDDQSAAEPATQAFSKNLSATVAFIASSGGLTDAATFHRLSEGWEMLYLAGFVLILTALCSASSFVRHLGMMVTVAVLLAAQWVTFGFASVWLPGLPAVAAILAAFVTASVAAKMIQPPLTQPATAPPLQPVPDQVPEVEALPLQEVELSAVPPSAPKERKARKNVAQKAPSKKVAAKKTASTPKRPRAPKPPPEA
jgi:hypothetical protein